VAASSGGYLSRRIAYIDGLRAVAVLSVVVFHVAHWDAKLGPGVLQHAFIEGAHGVDLFFVLSGFCLSYPVLRTMHARRTALFDIAGYAARRVVRIVPPYYLAILVIACGLLIIDHAGWRIPEELSVARVTWFNMAKQVLFADRRPEFLNPSFWTLAVEWRWYFIFPLVLVLWTRSMRAFIFVAACCVIAGAATRAGGFDLPILPAFMLGIVAAEIELQQRPVGRVAVLMCILAVCLGLFLEPYYAVGYFLQQQPGWQLAAFFFVLAAGSVPSLRAALSVRPLVWIGVASYSIYLIHEPVIGALEYNTQIPPALAGAVAVIAGVAFWAIFERPFMKNPLKGRLIAIISPLVARFATLVGVPSSIQLSLTTGGDKPKLPDQPSSKEMQTETLLHISGA